MDVWRLEQRLKYLGYMAMAASNAAAHSAADRAECSCGCDAGRPSNCYHAEGNVMLDVFVASLLAAAEVPSEVSGEPAQGASSSEVRCQDAETLTPDSAYNIFSPVTEDFLARFNLPSGAVLTPEWMKQVDFRLTQVEGPHHGQVKVADPATSSYIFMYVPDKGYAGKDRVVYEVKAAGQRHRVTINFWVVELVSEPEPGEPWVQKCESQDFTVLGPRPFGNLSVEIMFADLPQGAAAQSLGNAIVLDRLGAGYGWFVGSSMPRLGTLQKFHLTWNEAEWVARADSEAAGKLDLLRVLRDEYATFWV